MECERVISKKGRYKTREGDVAHVTSILSAGFYSVLGNINGSSRTWTKGGHAIHPDERGFSDLIKYLGPLEDETEKTPEMTTQRAIEHLEGLGHIVTPPGPSVDWRLALARELAVSSNPLQRNEFLNGYYDHGYVVSSRLEVINATLDHPMNKRGDDDKS